MLEIPEAIVISEQINETLIGKRIQEVIVNQSPHKFAWLSGDSNYYSDLLVGGKIDGARPIGGHIQMEIGEVKVVFAEGIKLSYLIEGEAIPKKHQFLMRFEDESVLVASVQMYGGMWCFTGEFDNEYYVGARDKLSALDMAFDFDYFKTIVLSDELMNKSVKEVLATKQRIPGLGNGVLQDILYNAKIFPKRKMQTLSQEQIKNLFDSVKNTLVKMTANGGRDTEKDLFGSYGNYKTKVCKKTVDQPCSICGSIILKKAFMGGSIYYCEGCQPE
jgi:formamidopyrimidine-DNA glycosylase